MLDDRPLLAPDDLSPGTSEAAAAGTIRWLLEEGHRRESMADLLEAYADHLRHRGAPVHRITLHVRLLHPVLRGISYIWLQGRPGVETVLREHGLEDSPGYLSSPIRLIGDEGAEGVRVAIHRIRPPYPFPVTEDLAAEGFTDYAAMPLIFSSGRRNVITFSTRAGNGFGTGDLALIYESLPAVTVLAEARALRLLATNLLDTYVGQDAGGRILSGDIRRGTGVTIAAVLWYCDLRGFTTLSERLPINQTISLLNAYFEIMGGAVTAQGGEILKFIGDAMLAIFPVRTDGEGVDDRNARCQAAKAAARTAVAGMARLNASRSFTHLPMLSAGIALHVGDVMYGNIGAPDRLDFTVIGPAVNLVSRLEAMTRRFDRHQVLVSADVAKVCPEGLLSLGFHPVKGMRQPVEVFGLDR